MPMVLRFARTAPVHYLQGKISQGGYCRTKVLSPAETKNIPGSFFVPDALSTSIASSPARQTYIRIIVYISCVVQVAKLSHIRPLSPAPRLQPLVAGATHFKAPRERLSLPIVPHSVANLNGLPKAFRKMEPSEGPPAAAIPADRRVQSVSSGEGNDPLVQYVVVRRDLDTELKWPAGAIIAQACHAAVDALGSAMNDNQADARRYLADGSNMRTVVLKVSNERELLALRDKLMQHQISHKLWQEEPEKIPTALATAPIRKSTGKVFKGIKLFS